MCKFCPSTKSLQTVPSGLSFLTPNSCMVLQNTRVLTVCFLSLPCFFWLNSTHPSSEWPGLSLCSAGRTSWSQIGSPSRFPGEDSNPLPSEPCPLTALYRPLKTWLLACLYNGMSLGKKRNAQPRGAWLTYRGIFTILQAMAFSEALRILQGV